MKNNIRMDRVNEKEKKTRPERIKIGMYNSGAKKLPQRRKKKEKESRIQILFDQFTACWGDKSTRLFLIGNLHLET